MKTFSTVALCVILAAGCLLQGPSAWAERTNVAVAANFTPAAKEIAAAFESATGLTATLSFGSTGKLYTQIVNGAPFKAFLAADTKHPKLLEREGLAVPGSQFTYAAGRIVLFSADPTLVDSQGAVLSTGSFRKLAIANPKTAPYGAAAVETMMKLGVYDRLLPKIVRGNTIAQTHQFIVTGNAQLGFVALSQVVNDETGSKWLVPIDIVAPIRQDAVLLKSGADSAPAKAFLAFLKGDEARAIIEKFGYGTE